MIFNILYSFKARQDLRDIYEYIAYELLKSGIASRQVNRIMKAVRSLEQMPMRCRCYEALSYYRDENALRKAGQAVIHLRVVRFLYVGRLTPYRSSSKTIFSL